MAGFRERVKAMMLSYPSIFPTKYHAVAHLFTCSASYGDSWDENGGLKDDGSPYYKTMRYDDVKERIAQHKADHKKYGSELQRPLTKMFILEEEAELERRRWTAKHIDTILDNGCGRAPFFRNLETSFPSCYMHRHHYMSDKSGVYNWPQHIAKDWAQGLVDFIGCWLTALHNEYGVGNDRDMDKAVSHWPADMLDVRKRLIASKEGLLTVITGKSPEVRAAEHREMMDRIMSEIRAEEAAKKD